MIKQIWIVVGLLLGLASPVLAFGDPGGCGAGKCSDCHSLNLQEATTLLKGVDKVFRVEFAEIPGLWIVDVEKDGQKFPLYIDFSKRYVVAGNVIRIADGQNITQQRQAKNGGIPEPSAVPKKLDIGRIPVQDSILLGRSDAKTKVFVFTDPECPYCKKLHIELKEVVRLDPNIAFLIKLFPLRKIHPNAYNISRTIMCSDKPLALLDASLAGAPVAINDCPTRSVDDTLALVESLGIGSTPTLVLPDGTIAPGYKKVGDLLKLLGSKVTPPKAN